VHKQVAARVLARHGSQRLDDADSCQPVVILDSFEGAETGGVSLRWGRIDVNVRSCARC